MAVRSDNRLWLRKVDGDMHLVAEQPQRPRVTGTEMGYVSTHHAIKSTS